MEIARELGRLYGERAEVEKRIYHIGQDRAARLVVLTPLEGWPGKNEGARKAASETAIATDETLAKIAGQDQEKREELAGINVQVETLEAERRALEWDIRHDIVKMLRGRQQESAYEPADGIAEHAMDQAAFGEAGAPEEYLGSGLNGGLVGAGVEEQDIPF